MTEKTKEHPTTAEGMRWELIGASLHSRRVPKGRRGKVTRKTRQRDLTVGVSRKSEKVFLDRRSEQTDHGGQDGEQERG